MHAVRYLLIRIAYEVIGYPIKSVSNWFYRHTDIILMWFAVILLIQVANRWDWSNAIVKILHLSGILDWIWYIYAVFTAITFINWFVIVFWRFLESKFFHRYFE
jgi:hypothetical protein